MAKQVIFNPSFFQKFKKLRQQVDEKGSATIQDLLQIGKAHSKAYVPKDTGHTMRSIKTRIKKTNSGPTGNIYIDPYLTKDGHSRNIGDFSLVRWMHTSAKARKHFHSGNPQFLYSTRDYLNKIKTGIAKGKFKTIHIK